MSEHEESDMDQDGNAPAIPRDDDGGVSLDAFWARLDPIEA